MDDISEDISSTKYFRGKIFPSCEIFRSKCPEWPFLGTEIYFRVGSISEPRYISELLRVIRVESSGFEGRGCSWIFGSMGLANLVL